MASIREKEKIMNCKSCGKPSKWYELCVECKEKVEKGEIIKCDKCGTYHKSSEKCVCDKCLICGGEKNGKMVCAKCFKRACLIELPKYKDKNECIDDYYRTKYQATYKIVTEEVIKEACLKLIAINNVLVDNFKCYDFQTKIEKDIILIITYMKDREELVRKFEKEKDYYDVIKENDYRKLYEAVYRTEDGHYVRSQIEREIDDYLFNHKIRHIYEAEIFDQKTDHKYYPDFELVDYEFNGKPIVLEHLGSNDLGHEDSNNYKIELFRKLGFKVYTTDKRDLSDIKSAISRILQTFEAEKSSSK